MILNQVKLMNEENCIKTTKNEEEFKETDEEICKIGKKIAGTEMQETNYRRGMKGRNKRKEKG